jgi:VWFA-related protein
MSSALQRMHPEGGTALYDAVAEALPLLQSGRHRKKALLVISDGIDTSSDTNLQTLKQLIRESEALVYAIGIDAQSTLTPFGGDAAFDTVIRQQRRRPIPLPFPMPGRSPRPRYPPIPGVPPGPGTPPPRMPPPNQPSNSGAGIPDEGVNAAALRGITDDSGGRSEIVRDARDLDPATVRIADELSKQYYLGYPSRGYRDGRWHTIRVEVRGQSVNVIARRGYIAAS